MCADNLSDLCFPVVKIISDKVCARMKDTSMDGVLAGGRRGGFSTHSSAEKRLQRLKGSCGEATLPGSHRPQMGGQPAWSLDTSDVVLSGF